MLINLMISTYAMVAYVTTVVFLGGLSTRETSRLTERLMKHIVFKFLFIGSIAGILTHPTFRMLW